jgi:hypothetical protein
VREDERVARKEGKKKEREGRRKEGGEKEGRKEGTQVTGGISSSSTNTTHK